MVPTCLLMLSLHNILPVLLLPTGMTLLLVLLGLLLRTKVLCWAGLVVLWLASTALVGDMAGLTRLLSWLLTPDSSLRVDQSWSDGAKAVAIRSRAAGSTSICTVWVDVESGVPQRKMARS